jgi:hypothetical protein
MVFEASSCCSAEWFSAIGTFAAAIVALFVAFFGNWAKQVFFHPNLTLRLVNSEGVLTEQRLSPITQPIPVRFYHLQVSNTKRVSPANDVQVFLTRVERRGPDREFRVQWDGGSSGIPMRWRDQEFYPLQRKIGPSIECDLCCVQENGPARILLLFTPYNLDGVLSPGQEVRLSLQARSTESRSDSPVVRVEIAWDGLWESGDNEMKKHFVVKNDGDVK